MSKNDEQERFRQIAEQLFGEDPEFARRTQQLETHNPNRRTNLLAIVSLVTGFPLMIVSVAVNSPMLGLLFFIGMLAGTLPAARALLDSTKNPQKRPPYIDMKG